jgi:hypothetical protein
MHANTSIYSRVAHIIIAEMRISPLIPKNFEMTLFIFRGLGEDDS